LPQESDAELVCQPCHFLRKSCRQPEPFKFYWCGYSGIDEYSCRAALRAFSAGMWLWMFQVTRG